jgi:hypothetical protein
MKANETVATQLRGFIDKIQLETSLYFEKHFDNSSVPTFEFTEGGKFYKIIRISAGSRSVHCFVNKENGDI